MMRINTSCSMENCTRHHYSSEAVTDSVCGPTKLESDFYKNLILNNFSAANWVFLSTVTLAFVVLVSKIQGLTEFKWNDVTFPLSYSWTVFLILTILEGYFGQQLLTSIRALLDTDCSRVKIETYLEVVSSKNVFVRGLNKKPPLLTGNEKVFYFKMDKTDYSYKMRTLANWILFFSVINYHGGYIYTLGISVKSLFAALAIVYANALFTSRYFVEFYRLAYYTSRDNKYELISNF